MSAEANSAGSEIDSYCTKCRLVLNHRIIAMVGTRPVRVECSTCGSHHNYRPRAPGERATASGTGRTRSAGSAAKPTRAEKSRADYEREWEQAVSGKSPSDFKKYTIDATFEAGDLVAHKKFGDGVVTSVVDESKVEIMFRDELRTLAQGLAT